MRTILFFVILTGATPQLLAAQHTPAAPVAQWARLAADTTTIHSSFDPNDRELALRAPFTSYGSRPAAMSMGTLDTATLVGAGVGFLAGAGATWAILHSGGSTALCNRDANQDAMSAGECLGITVLGGVAGALLGAVVARWLSPDR